MRRSLFPALALVALFTIGGCIDQPSDPLGPDGEELLGKKGPAGCLSTEQQTLANAIQSDINSLFVGKGSKNAATQQLNNITRKLCDKNFADALDKAFGFLGLVDEKYPGNFSGGPADAAELASEVFALVGAPPNPAGPAFEIPAGAFDPETGGIIMFDPDNVTLPFVAGTGNNEAAVVLDEPGIFPPGTGTVTIILSRAPGNLVTTFGAFIPGFQAFEEGYEILSSHQPAPLGPGILVALCGVPPLPADAPIGHLHEGAVSLLVPTDPDPQELGYIDCSNVVPTTTILTQGIGDAIGAPAPAWVHLARRAVEPVAQLLAPPPLHAEALAQGPGLGGRTKSLSLNAPVDPVISQGESVQLSAGFDATWSSDDEGIATVDEFGLVTGVCPGTTHINAEFDVESSLPIRITVVEGEGGGDCGGEELPEPILEQTGAFFGEGDGDVIWDLSITNADDYDPSLFTNDGDYGSCGIDLVNASRLSMTIYDASGEIPVGIAFFCSITDVDELADFELYDEFGDYSSIFVEIFDYETEDVVQSNTISLIFPETF